MIDDDYEFPEDSAHYSDDDNQLADASKAAKTQTKATAENDKPRPSSISPPALLKKENESVGGSGFEEFSIEDSLSKDKKQEGGPTATTAAILS